MSTVDSERDPIDLLRRMSSEEVPEERRALVRSRLASALQGASSLDLPSTTAGAARPAATAGESGTGSLAAAHGAVRSWKVLASRFASWSLPALVVGVVAGAAAERTFVAPRSKALAEHRAEWSAPAVPAPARDEAVPPPEVAPSEGAPAVAPALPSALGNPSSGTLAAERALLDRVRASIVAGEPARALPLVERHARRYPQGALAEEREALAVNVLVALGRREEAVQRGEAFRARYPGSLLMPSVEAALSVAGQP